MTDPDSLARVRAEFDSLKGDETDFEKAFRDILTLEATGDLTYLGYVIHETLRINPVGVATTGYWFEKDMKLGYIDYKAHTVIMINIYGLHRNENYWQRPYEFLPDRFDPRHELSKTPSGEKRSPYAWLPFNGGKRICFGKNFAEYVLRVMLTMATQRFDFEFIE